MSREANAEPAIVQYWDEEAVPGYLDDLIATFRDRNPGMRHMLFSERTAAQFIAEHFGEREAAAFAACAVPTMQSDYFRYCAVYVLGGIYADVAFRCAGPLRPLLEGSDEATLFRVEPLGFLLSGFFAFRAAGNPLPRLVIDVATVNIERRATEMVQMVTGPWILSSLSLLHRLGSEDAFRDAVERDGIECLAEPFRREVASLIPRPQARQAIPHMAGPLFEAVGDYDRIVAAFEGVRILPFEPEESQIEAADVALPYKEDERYWINWQRQRSIFR